MSTPQNRLTPTPVRQDAVCMCVHGSACSSFAPGHAVHLIQARLASATPAEWRDAIVTATDAADGTLTLHTLEGDALVLWNGAGAAAAGAVGTPVAYHERYHTLAIGTRLFNALAL
ncbi:hypothetical protein [Microbacterium flavum]|uniref:Uncharacterized protein n=1 Tax=Microbacterium flavum TaxID=415216 RepID=A0ABS5XSW1_9MICO|nr:hypothetical protein [Microbacterium flavum]MBT8797032.1 hypothetical protein [Microbacterium flavum]